MPCVQSKPAWKAKAPNENGRYELRFKNRQDTPDYFIPCGKCIGCTTDRRRDWGIRMYHEAQLHEQNCFVTLTYEDAPPQLSKHHVKTFIQRLQHHAPDTRYFLCGEYGEKTRRPHYHAILFGIDFLGGAYDINDSMYGNVRLDRIWKHGQTSITPFSMSTAMYTAGYVNKKINDKDTFNSMSRNPPIGKEWVRKHYDNMQRLKSVIIEGRELPIPKVYMEWLRGEENFDKIREERATQANTLGNRESINKRLNYQARESKESI